MGKLVSRLLIILLALLVVSFTFPPDMVMAQRTYTYSLSVSVEPSGGGRVTPESGTYDSGTELTLYATPSSGYEFDYWSGDASGTDPSVRIVMDSDKRIVAHFSRSVEQYSLSVSVEPSGGGRVTPESGTYDSGTELTLYATPGSGYEFDYWSGDASGTAPSVRIVMDSDKRIVAHFISAVEPGLPDLAVRDIEFEAETGLIRYWLSNTGDANAPEGHTITLWVDGESVYREVMDLGIVPGQTLDFGIACYAELPIVWDEEEEIYKLERDIEVRVCADFYDDMAESNEDNNCATEEYAAAVPTTIPDLVIRGVLCDEENLLINYGIANIGNGVAPAGHVSMLSVNGEEVARQVIGVDISPGETLERWFRGYDWGGTAIEVTVCADFYGKVSESDEDNNCVTEEYAATVPSALPVVIRPASQRANPGETFPVFIWTDPSHYGVSGGSVTMSFNADAMQVDEVAAGDLLGTEAIIAPGFPRIDNESGVLEIDLARTGSTPVPTAPGALAEITFMAKDIAPEGTYDLLINEVELSDESYNSIPGIAKEDGTVRIAETQYSRSNVDTNQDGEVDFKDLATVRGVYGLSEGETGFNTSVDFNNDGLIDYRDLAILGALYGEPEAPVEPATCGLPDLEVTLHSEQTYVEGDEVKETIEITVRNKGSVAVPGLLDAEPGEAYYIVDLILSKDLDVPVGIETYIPSPYVFEEDMLLKGGRLSNTETLAPGESRTYSVDAPPLDITGKIPPGTSPGAYLCAVVDPDDWIDECNEDNNVSCYLIKVLEEECALPDLEVTLHLEQTYVEGDEVKETVEITVHNKGSVAVPGLLDAEPGEAYYIVDLILSKDLDVPVGIETYIPSPYVFEEDMLLEGGRLANTETLAPGESRTYSVDAPPLDITGKIPPGTSPGAYLCAVVDPDDWIDECNEDNNVSCYLIKVLEEEGYEWISMSSPTNELLSGVWGTSSSDVFAVGYWGTILHYDGTIWTTMSSGYEGGTTSHLWSAWGYCSSDVFAVGSSGTILHYDGNDWIEMNSGTSELLSGMWGTGWGPCESPLSYDVFAVGSSGTILHYDGNDWIEMNSGTNELLSGVWGTSSSDVFAVGSSGTILHYDGNDWTEMNSGTNELLSGVWGTSSSDVFAVGYWGTILHYDGSQWLQSPTSLEEVWGVIPPLNGLWGCSTDIFAVGQFATILYYEQMYEPSKEWTQMSSNIPSSTSLNSVWGAAPFDVFAVGDTGIILHYTYQ